MELEAKEHLPEIIQKKKNMYVLCLYNFNSYYYLRSALCSKTQNKNKKAHKNYFHV